MASKVEQVANLRKARAEAAERRTHKHTPTKAAKTKAPEKTRPAPAVAETRAIKPGSKLAKIVKLLTREGGCTRQEVLRATQWPSVSLQQQATAAGLKLRKQKRDGVTYYSAA